MPNWQSVRSRVEYGAGALEALSRMVPSNLQAGAIILMLARGSAPDWVTADGIIAPPITISRSMSVNSIAASLMRPFETIRRHVQWLVDEGFVIRVPDGVALANVGPRCDLLADYVRNRHDSFLRLVADLVAAEDMLERPPRVEVRPISTIQILTAAFDLDLAPFESNRSLLANLELTTVYSAIAMAGTRAVQADPILSARYRHQRTPDELRQPVSLRFVAERFNLSYATVWRHAHKLMADGLVTRLGNKGWVVRMDDLHQEELLRASQAYFRRLRRIMRTLIFEGFDPYAPSVVRRC